MTVMVFEYLVLISIYSTILFLYFLSFNLTEKIYQTLQMVFDHISKRLKVRQNTPLPIAFSTLFSVFGNLVINTVFCEIDINITYDKHMLLTILGIHQVGDFNPATWLMGSTFCLNDHFVSHCHYSQTYWSTVFRFV